MDVTATYELHHGDMLEVMPTLKKGSIQMCFLDLPYAATDNQWDCKIDLHRLWPMLRFTCARHSALVFTATQRFACEVVASNAKLFRYDLIVPKKNAVGFLNSRRQPLRSHEIALVFYEAQPTYNPQKTVSEKAWTARRKNSGSGNWSGLKNLRPLRHGSLQRYPTSVLPVQNEARMYQIHPTQKPVALLEWLIATYTNPGDTVLDPCFGSNTTGVACARLGRRYIGIEKDPDYFRIGKKRLEGEHRRLAEGPAQAALAI